MLAYLPLQLVTLCDRYSEEEEEFPPTPTCRQQNTLPAVSSFLCHVTNIMPVTQSILRILNFPKKTYICT